MFVVRSLISDDKEPKKKIERMKKNDGRWTGGERQKFRTNHIERPPTIVYTTYI
jgi:hypothetical protein